MVQGRHSLSLQVVRKTPGRSEAKGAYSRREFAAKNSIVLKEARESRMWLRLILACHLAPDEETRPLFEEANQLVGIFIATVRTLKNPPK